MKIGNSKEIVFEKQPNGCIYCTSHCMDSFGYTRIKYNGKQERLFRVLYILKYGDIPKDMVIRHKCDNPSCCNIEHLELGTQNDNVNDMIQRNRYAKHHPNIMGEKNGQHKLTQQQVNEIRNSNESQRVLAQKYNVSATTIHNIKTYKYWKFS